MIIRVILIFAAFCSVAAAPFGELCQPAYCLDHAFRGPMREYVPQAGDIVLYNDEGSMFWNLGFKAALSGPPYHSGIIVRLPDGTYGTLEAGPEDGNRVVVTVLAQRLKFHACNRGQVWIRQRKIPLTDEENCRLTAFALSEWGKPFAHWRMCGQATLLRSRGLIKTYFMGASHGPRDSYWCSELVMEACVNSGLLDPKTSRPSATLPRDLFFDRSINLYINKHLHLNCAWEPPARWRPDECPCCKAYKGTYSNPNPEGVAEHPYQARMAEIR